MSQALAIKYRPKTFDELIGQDTVSTSLKFALDEGRLAHAYLFSGLRGSGKTSSARIFARALVCEAGPASTPCGSCPQCEASLAGRHVDIVEMDAASNRGIDDIASLIEQTKYAPAMARFKIFIIDEVHMLTTPAANALLKTLEEPPGYVKFILATTDPLKLPATVLSRTQHFRFRQIAQSEIARHLGWVLGQEGVEFEEEALRLLARSGGGSLRDVLTLLDQAIIFCGGVIRSEGIAKLLGFLDPAKVGEFYTAITSQDREGLFALLEELQDYEAGAIIDELIFYLKEKFFARSEDFSTLLYERFFRILSRAKGLLSDDDGFTICVMSFMMMEAVGLREIDGEIAQLAAAPAPASAAPTSQIPATPAAPATAAAAPTSAYETLLAAIYERDYELGECFKRHTTFLAFEGDVLKISSQAEGADREQLNRGFKLIQELARARLGEGVKITVQKAKPDPHAKTKQEIKEQISQLQKEAREERAAAQESKKKP